MRSEHQLLATLFAMGIRHQVVYPFYNGAAEAWGLHRVWVHYITLDLWWSCWPMVLRPKILFTSFPTALTSVPTPREGWPLIFAKLGTDSMEGGLLTGPRLYWIGSSISQPQVRAPGGQLLPALRSDGRTTVRVRKASSWNLRSCPYFVLAAFIRFLLMQVGDQKG